MSIWNEPKLVPCKHCGEPDGQPFTKECDGCWELRHRIEDDPALAAKIFVTVRKERLNIEPLVSNPEDIQNLQDYVKHKEECILQVCRLPVPVLQGPHHTKSEIDNHYAAIIERLRGRI